jgi:hypothetical protein
MAAVVKSPSGMTCMFVMDSGLLSCPFSDIISVMERVTIWGWG